MVPAAAVIPAPIACYDKLSSLGRVFFNFHIFKKKTSKTFLTFLNMFKKIKKEQTRTSSKRTLKKKRQI